MKNKILQLKQEYNDSLKSLELIAKEYAVSKSNDTEIQKLLVHAFMTGLVYQQKLDLVKIQTKKYEKLNKSFLKDELKYIR